MSLQVLIDFILIANRNQQGFPKDVYGLPEDNSGEPTINALKKGVRLANRVTGNDGGSLGLHPAVYFYGPSGRHSSPMFMGTMKVLGEKLSNNDSMFFKKFTKVRAELEEALISSKDLIATVLQKTLSSKRVDVYATMLEKLIATLDEGNEISDEFIVIASGLNGKLITGSTENQGRSFSEDVKSQAFIHAALSSAIKCPICYGYLDPDKSVSYDHVVRLREAGTAAFENCQLTHPYCNQSIKN